MLLQPTHKYRSSTEELSTHDKGHTIFFGQMSSEKPIVAKPLQQLLRVLLLCRILNTNEGTSSGLPNREIPTDVPLSPETENMVDPFKNEEPHRCRRSHCITLQCGCVTLSDLLNTSPFWPTQTPVLHPLALR